MDNQDLLGKVLESKQFIEMPFGIHGRVHANSSCISKHSCESYKE